MDRYENITYYLLTLLIDEILIDYDTNADLLNKLVNQVIDHITSYSGSELNTRKILFFNNKDIAKDIYEQIKNHVKQAPVKLNIRVDSGYATITTASYKITVTEGAESVNYKAHIQDKSKIRNMAFEGFNKCLFAKQKFDSCTEKDLCEILESAPEVLKWFKINNDRAREIFDIKYQDVSTHEVKTYLPDFIVETTKAKYMIETKAEKDIDDKTVQAKKDAAVRWCEIATKFEEEHNGKPWYYLLIPDTMVVLNRTFDKLVADCKEG